MLLRDHHQGDCHHLVLVYIYVNQISHHWNANNSESPDLFISKLSPHFIKDYTATDGGSECTKIWHGCQICCIEKRIINEFMWFFTTYDQHGVFLEVCSVIPNDISLLDLTASKALWFVCNAVLQVNDTNRTVVVCIAFKDVWICLNNWHMEMTAHCSLKNLRTPWICSAWRKSKFP